MRTAKLVLNGQEYELPVMVGSEGETAIDIAQLRSQSMTITLDPGFGNTGACGSEIAFIDGEQGILRYRGYPIEELARSAGSRKCIICSTARFRTATRWTIFVKGSSTTP